MIEMNLKFRSMRLDIGSPQASILCSYDFLCKGKPDTETVFGVL